MTFLEIFQILGLATIFGALISTVVSHFLQIRRASDERIFIARREAYAEVMEVINYSYLRENGLEKAGGDLFLIENIILELGQCLSKARILASKKLSNELREFYDIETQFLKNSGSMEELRIKRLKLVSKIEELIRKDLGIKN